MARVRVSTKGQVVIPADVRRELNLEAGDEMLITVHEGSVYLTPLGSDRVGAMHGMFRGDDSPLTEELLSERRDERRREETAGESAAKSRRRAG